MTFSASNSECVHLTITHKLYSLGLLHLNIQSVANHAIQQVTRAKYLGITITSDLGQLSTLLVLQTKLGHFYKGT